MSPRFTVLIPTYNNGAMIHTAIASVLRQSAQDFEVFVVLDGAPDATLNIVRGYAANDPRIRPFVFPKGERHGEAWRDMALREAQGTIVCYLSDDDFWFHDHLETMASIMEDADFGHTRHTSILPNFRSAGYSETLADAATRERMLTTGSNFFGISVAGHRLESYLRLPVGWAPAPRDLPTDLHMWRKWLTAPGMRLKSSSAITSLHFARSLRKAMPQDIAVEEGAFWLEVFADPAVCKSLRRLSRASVGKVPMAKVIAASRQPT